MIGTHARYLGVEGLGTAVLSAGVIGAGLLAERFPGQLPLSADWLVALTGGILIALVLGSTGGRFNPALTLADVIVHRVEPEPAAWRAGAQIAGAILGAMTANAAFDMGAIQHGGRDLAGIGIWIGEAAATFAFVAAVSLALSLGRAVGGLVAGIGLVAVYLFSPSMSLANPALLIARTLSDSYLGVNMGDAAVLLVCQLGAAGLAGLACAAVVRHRRVSETLAQ